LNFVTIVFKNHIYIYKVGSREKNCWNIGKVHNLQIRLPKNEILGFSYFQVNGVLKCTCRLPTFSYYNQNESKF
jgi:hypothetical protein